MRQTSHPSAIQIPSFLPWSLLMCKRMDKTGVKYQQTIAAPYISSHSKVFWAENPETGIATLSWHLATHFHSFKIISRSPAIITKTNHSHIASYCIEVPAYSFHLFWRCLLHHTQLVPRKWNPYQFRSTDLGNDSLFSHNDNTFSQPC